MRSRRRRAAAIAALGAIGWAAAPALGGGLAISPAIVEHPATPGSVGALVVTNGTGKPLRIAVTPRPWRQARDGRTTPDRRRTLRADVRASPAAFTLATGARQAVDLTLLRSPSGGSHGPRTRSGTAGTA